MKTSMRNCIEGMIESVKSSLVNDEIILVTPGGERIAAINTNESTRELNLAPGVAAYALINPSWISLSTDIVGLKVSSRNTFHGKISNIVDGKINTEIETTLPSGQIIIAVITRSSFLGLKLKVGQEIFLLVKASDVLLAAKP